ncbi:MAG: SIR2 family protein [Phycisphaerales bacterium]
MAEDKIQSKKPYLPRLPDVIRNAVDNGDLVVFIGAGVSALIGCKRWSVLAMHLAEECFKENCINYSEKEQLKNDRDHLKVISVAYELLKIKGREECFNEKLKKALEPNEENNCSDIYDRLWKFGGVFITTNADKCFHKNFISENILRLPEEFETEGIKRRRLYHIHGCIDNIKTLVFTKNRYLERYSKNDTAFCAFIEKVFSRDTPILFVGYGLKEFELLSLLMNPNAQDKEYNRFALMPYYKHDQHLLKFDKIYFKNFGINILEYYIDEKGYEELYEVIKNWSDEISLTTKLAHDDHKLIDSVVK